MVPLGIWSIMATIRWCPIYPKWDSYQPLLINQPMDPSVWHAVLHPDGNGWASNSPPSPVEVPLHPGRPRHGVDHPGVPETGIPHGMSVIGRSNITGKKPDMFGLDVWPGMFDPNKVHVGLTWHFWVGCLILSCWKVHILGSSKFGMFSIQSLHFWLDQSSHFFEWSPHFLLHVCCMLVVFLISAGFIQWIISRENLNQKAEGFFPSNTG